MQTTCEMTEMNRMTISKAARKAGVGVETIRFYERKGLIEQPAKPSALGFRDYPPETVDRVRFIRQAQELGFSLREAGDLLSLRAGPEADESGIRGHATATLAEVEGKIRRLEQIRQALTALIAACPGRGTLRECTILEALTDSEAADGAKAGDGRPA